jgi:flagellar M-ring protein FliF
MKDLLVKLWEAVRGTNVPTRIVVGAGFVLALAIAGVFGLRAWDPSFVLLRSGLDATQISDVSSAIASTGVRFKTSEPPGPFSIWVEEGRQYEALGAAYLAGALDAGPRGITASRGGAASVFMGSGERTQQLQKRKWEEVEEMLEVYKWISRATVTSSSPAHSPLMRTDSETISVVLELRGITEPDAEQRGTVAKIVSSAFGVPPSRVVVSDQYGRTVFDGSEDDGPDDVLTFQRRYDETLTRDVQRILDETYGPGMATAAVKSHWTYDHIESIDETVDPSTKTPISKIESETSTPQSGPTVGGYAGTASNVLEGSPAPAATGGTSESATTSQLQEDYLVGRRTTHRVQDTPLLDRLTVTLLVDESLAAELPGAEVWVKGVVAYDESRGDLFTSGTARFSSIQRDADGKPILPEPEPVPEPPNAILELALEHGVEILAALAFLIVLARSLKKSDKASKTAAVTARAPEEDEVDLDLLARRRVDDMILKDPDQVSALLSRWALEETPSRVGAPR